MSHKSKLKLSDCRNSFQQAVSDIFQAVSDMGSSEKNEAKRHIVQEFMSLSMSSDDIKQRVTTEDAERFAIYTINQIENKASVIDGKPNQVEFTPNLL